MRYYVEKEQRPKGIKTHRWAVFCEYMDGSTEKETQAYTKKAAQDYADRENERAAQLGLFHKAHDEEQGP